MHFHVIIIGAGPAGLACAQILSQNGIKTLVVEKKKEIGPKVCAGGLTWGGLADAIPQDLIERAFPVQHIRSRYQKTSLCSPSPIIVTVNRKRLGQFMLKQAVACGAEILPETRVEEISGNTLILRHTRTKTATRARFNYLVGADGSQSLVRRFTGLCSSKMGIGIHYQIPGLSDRMEWHLNGSFFKNGYGWIFPHRDTISVGAYCDGSVLTAHELKERLIRWAMKIRIDLSKEQCRAECINFDYQGWEFGHIFLAGDAAGLASALTGEGIYPAVISGKMVAHKIIDPGCDLTPMHRLIKKHRLHSRIVSLTGKSSLCNALLSEVAVLGLRMGLLRFHLLEMAD